MNSYNVKMVLERETKGAGKYAEQTADGKLLQPGDSGAKIGSMYFRKDGFPNGALPQTIKLTVEF